MGDARLDQLLDLFERLRAALQRKPGTAELLQWLRLADRNKDIRAAANSRAMGEPLKCLIGVLAKQESDITAASRAIDDWSR
jgi:hypothetical protein